MPGVINRLSSDGAPQRSCLRRSPCFAGRTCKCLHTYGKRVRLGVHVPVRRSSGQKRTASRNPHCTQNTYPAHRSRVMVAVRGFSTRSRRCDLAGCDCTAAASKAQDTHTTAETGPRSGAAPEALPSLVGLTVCLGCCAGELQLHTKAGRGDAWYRLHPRAAEVGEVSCSNHLRGCCTRFTW